MNSRQIPAQWLTKPTSLEEITSECQQADSKVAELAQQYLQHASRFAKTMQVDDQLWRYVMPGNSPSQLIGEAGLAIVRDGKVVDSICMVSS